MKLIMVILLILLPACDEKSTGADTCGDSILDPGESCDSANLNDETCQTLGFHGGALVCTGECQFDTAPCQVFGRCGDGILQEAETCEGENFGGATCFSLEQLPGGDLQCDENCQVDTSGCNNCGDGVLQTGEGESCDDQEMNGTQCTDLGFYGGELGCSDSCRFVTDLCEGFCVDGIIQEGDESCDGTNLGSATCYEGGFFRGESVLCDGTCQFDPQSPDCVSAVTISAGSDHYCVVDSLQKAWCWGNGAYGKLGTGTTVSKTVPAAVNTDTLFTMISAGYSHTCAIDTVGNGWCWGENIYGQLGIGDSTADGVTPMDMSPMAGATFRELQVGSQMSCGIDTQSRVWCWGDN
ncbi:hypothetical protein KJ865_14225, partial [Myxococcota bacterium]|nr:hypothetical protein [Myxococcota bacterium]